MATDPPITENLRSLLLASGLSESEVDSFLRLFRQELISGSLTDKESITAFVQTAVNELINSGAIKTITPRDRLIEIIIAILIGYLVNTTTPILSNEVSKLFFKTLPKPPQAFPDLKLSAPIDEMLMDWWGKPPFQKSSLENDLTPLRHLSEAYPTLDQRTAYFLDARATFLDWLGRHREALRLRETVLKIEQTRNGPYHRRTAVALSNLGLCLAAQERYKPAIGSINKALAIIKRSGTDGVATACIAYNMHEIAKHFGTLRPDAFAPYVTDKAINDLRHFMMARKFLRISFNAMGQLIAQLKISLR